MLRSASRRASTAPRIPSPRTVSPPARVCSTKCHALAEASPTSACKCAVRVEFTNARTMITTPENTARRPNIQWKVNKAKRNTGVQGASKNANGPGPDVKRCIASRSWSPVAGWERTPAERPARVRIAPRTRPSSWSWKRAPARASTRARKWSKRPIIRNRKATIPASATSVASEREVRTRS